MARPDDPSQTAHRSTGKRLGWGRAGRTLVVAANLMLTACGLTGPGACTLVGCSDGISIEFDGPRPQEFTLKLRVSGSQPLTIVCDGSSQCGSTIFVPDLTPQSLEVTVTTPDGSATATFTPEYAEYYPNGPECDEHPCLQARIRVPVP